MPMKLYQGGLRRVNSIDSPVSSQNLANSRADAALALVEEAVCVIDWQGSIRYLNPATARLFGLNADAAVDRPWDQVLRVGSASVQAQLATQIAAALDGRSSIDPLRLSIPIRRGPIQVTAQVHALSTSPPEALLLLRDASAVPPPPKLQRATACLKTLERIASAAAQSEDLATAMHRALDIIRTSLDADRAWLIAPCEPQATTWHVPYEATRRGFPGLAADGGATAMTPEIARILSDALAASEPLLHPDVSRYGAEVHRKYRVRSQMLLALHPQGGPPWLLGVHHCGAPRDWSPQETQLLAYMGERLTAALTQHLLQQQLRDDIRHRQDIERALLRTLADHRRLIDAIPDAVLTLDRTGRLVRWNAALEHISGRAPEALRGCPFGDLFPPEQGLEMADHVRECLTGGGTETENHLTTADGSLRLFHWIMVALLDENGDFGGVTAVGRDITQRRHTQAQLRRTAAMFEDALECFLIMDHEFRVQSANRAFLNMTGWSTEDVLHRDVFELGWLSERNAAQQIQAQLAEEGHWQGEMWTRGATRAFCRISINAVYDTYNRLDSYVLVSTDITELRQTQEQLQFLAHHDPLTGLANRVLFGAMLKQAVEEAESSGERFALFYIDMDGFKQVNDQLGHQAGDRLLAAVGKRLAQVVREKRSTARLGGDEFTLLVRRIEENAAVETVARRVLSTLSSPVGLGDREIRLTASIGIALFPDHGRTPDALMHAADQAMYAAKSSREHGYAIAVDAAAD